MTPRSRTLVRGRGALAWAGALAVAFAITGCEELPPAPVTPNLPPTSEFFYTPVAPIVAGQTSVAFNAMGSRDVDGHIASFVWNFGDGTPEVTTTTPNTVHVFPDTGSRCLEITYGVSLQVVDEQGDRGVATEAVKVTELPAPTSQECTGR
ncbi:MAG TPA: PKD domain-containing protein [Vicinamibacteria bacterium]|nr:PKD domain-containing protein [Vicinamibacteria bacterium]